MMHVSSALGASHAMSMVIPLRMPIKAESTAPLQGDRPTSLSTDRNPLVTLSNAGCTSIQSAPIPRSHHLPAFIDVSAKRRRKKPTSRPLLPKPIALPLKHQLIPRRRRNERSHLALLSAHQRFRTWCEIIQRVLLTQPTRMTATPVPI